MTWDVWRDSITGRLSNGLKKLGFSFERQAAGSHEIWHNNASGLYTTIPNHPGDMPEGTLRAILKQANITPDDYLRKK